MFVITLTGTQSSVTFYDLGERVFTYPTTFDLETEYTIDEITYSADVFNAISSGYMTAQYNGIDVTSMTQVLSVRNNDYRMYATNELRVKKNPGLGEFSSIATALASITGNSTTNRFRVLVGPGTYVEPTLQMLSYVDVIGDGLNTVIQTNASNQHVVIGADFSSINFCVLAGATGAGYSAVYYTSPNTAWFSLDTVQFGTNDTMATCVGEGDGNCIILCENVMYGNPYQYNQGFYATSAGSPQAGIGRIFLKASTSNGGFLAPYPTFFAKADQPGCEIIMNAVQVKTGNPSPVGVCIWAENGANLRLTSVNINMWGTGIYVPNVGTGPTIRAMAMNFENNVQDVTIENTAATGKILGPDDILKYNLGNSQVYILNVDTHIITVSKTGGDFTSVAAAVDFITDSSITNRYTIKVGPGIYVEPLIDLSSKQYICIVGDSIESTKIMPDGPHHIISLGSFDELSFFWLEGAQEGYAAIAYLDQGNYGQVHKLTFYNNDTNILVTSETQDTYFYGEYIDYNSTYRYGTVVTSNNGYVAFANLENYYNFPTTGFSPGVFPYGTYVSGTEAQVFVLASGHNTLSIGNPPTGGTCFYADNGAQLNISATDIQGWTTGIQLGNVGAAPDLVALSTNQENNLSYDLLVQHPSATGGYQGTANMEMVSIDSSATDFVIGIQDTSTGALNISNQINLRFDNGLITDLSTAIIETSSMGVINGGVLSKGVAASPDFTVDVSAGFGYQDLTNGILQKVVWDDTSITLSPNVDVYLYFNPNKILIADQTPPDTEENILLGRVVTNSEGIEFIDASPLFAHHMGNTLSNTIRTAFGPVYASGSLVTEHDESPAMPFMLDVSPGVYFFAENEFQTSGGQLIDFSSVYRDGMGGFIFNNTNLVDTNNYDNGSGVLQPLTPTYYAKHSLYVVGQGSNEQYYLVYGQTEFVNLATAQAGSIPIPPPSFVDSVTLIAGIIVQQGASMIAQILDQRPVIGFRPPTVTATLFHGNLLGLANDDHKQYLLVSGTRAMAGDLNMGGNNIDDVGLVDGVDVPSHASRHEPNGADPLATGIPVTVDFTNQEGTANAFARQDHVHALPTTTVVPGTYGDSTDVPIITVDAYGRITNITTTPGQSGILSMCKILSLLASFTVV